MEIVLRIVIAAVALLVARGCHQRFARAGVLEGWAAVWLPAAAAILLAVMAGEWIAAPIYQWNSARLAVTFALQQGHVIYPGAGEGPVLGHIYGPVPAYVFWPATWFASPEAAVGFACFLCAVMLIGAVAWMNAAVARNEREQLWGVWGTILFAAMAVVNNALNYCLFSVHADAPAIAFELAACAVMLAPANRERTGRLFASAAFAALAIWSKQTAAPLMLALPLYVLCLHGKRLALRYAGMLFACLMGLGLVFVARFGFAELWYNMLTIPGHHPWLRSLTGNPHPFITGSEPAARLAVLGQAACGLAFSVSMPAGIFIIVAWLESLARSRAGESTTPSSGGWGSWMAARPWTLPAFAGLWLLPTALLGRVKAGGDVNAFGPPVALLAVAGTLALARGLASLQRDAGWSFTRTVQRLMAGVVAVVTVACAVHAVRHAQRLIAAKERPLSSAVAYVRAHPGELYFPWHPLVTLMGEGKAYHLGFGVYDRELAGHRLTDEQLHAGLPEHLRGVAYPLGSYRILLADRFPGFQSMLQAEEMRGWIVFERAPRHE